jgi:hypothetical protein
VDDRRFGSITKLRKERTTQTSQKNLSQSVAQKFQNFLLKFGKFFLKETGIAQEKKGCFVSVIFLGLNSTVCNQKRRPWQQEVQRFFWEKKWLTVTTL